MSNQNQTPEQIITELKAQLFDAGQVSQHLNAQLQEAQGVLQTIAQTLTLTPDEKGQITFDQLIDAVKGLVESPQPEGDAGTDE